MTAPGTDARALIALSAGAVLIGLAPIFVRLADVGPISAAFWRCALAWPVLALASRGETGSARLAEGGARGLLIGAGLLFAIDLSLWHVGIGMTTVANATWLANLAPLFVAPAAWLLWRDRVNSRFLLGLVASLAGTAILIGDGLRADGTRLMGDALSIAAAAFYAGYLLCVSQLRRRHSTLRILSWSSATVAVVLLPVAIFAGERILPSSTRGWALLAGLALLSHVGGQGLIAYSMASLPAAFSSVGLLVQPLAAAMFAWVLLHERFGWQQALGGAVILGGIWLCRAASRTTAPPSPTITA